MKTFRGFHNSQSTSRDAWGRTEDFCSDYLSVPLLAASVWKAEKMEMEESNRHCPFGYL